MAQSRIEAYDKQSQIIQYWYEPHDSDEIVHVTENVLVFIGKLIQHILPTHFKSIRYAGIYASQDKKYKEKKKRYKQKQAFQEFIHRYRNTIILVFKRDPQNIPSWLIDEICDMNQECDLEDHFIAGCYRCNKDTMVTMKYSIKNK